MTTIFDVYDFMRELTDKAGKGFLTPQAAGTWMGATQTGMFNEARTGGLLDNRTQDLLGPFAKTAAFTSSAAGVVTRPTDYVQSLRLVDSNGREIRPVLFSELYDALRSVLEPIEDHRRYTETESGFVIYPNQLRTGSITYYRLPAQPVVNYDTTVYANTGVIQYQSSGSVQLEIPKAYWPELIKRTLAYIGVELSDADLFAFSQNPAA